MGKWKMKLVRSIRMPLIRNIRIIKTSLCKIRVVIGLTEEWLINMVKLMRAILRILQMNHFITLKRDSELF